MLASHHHCFLLHCFALPHKSCVHLTPLPYPMLQCGASQIRRVASLNDHPTFVAVSLAHLHCMCLSSNILTYAPL